MSVDPSQPLNLLRLAKAGEQLQGLLDISRMRRVMAFLPQSDGQLSYCLSFSFDDTGRICIQVELKAELQVICQRCLQPMQIDIDRESWLALIKDRSEMETLPARFEPLTLVDEDDLSILALLEDELLLAIPFAPLHPESECSASEDVKRLQVEGKPNPFASLAQLKKD